MILITCPECFRKQVEPAGCPECKLCIGCCTHTTGGDETLLKISKLVSVQVIVSKDLLQDPKWNTVRLSRNSPLIEALQTYTQEGISVRQEKQYYLTYNVGFLALRRFLANATGQDVLTQSVRVSDEVWEFITAYRKRNTRARLDTTLLRVDVPKWATKKFWQKIALK